MSESKQNNQNIAVALIIAGVILVVSLLAYFAFKRYLKNQAIQECMTIGTEEYTYPENNSKATSPNRGSYEFCIKEKGYETVSR